MRMTKSHVPKRLIENIKPSNTIANLRRQRKLRCLMRIDGINSTFNLALVNNLPHGQGLNGKEIFIKIAPAFVIMTDFMD